MPKTNSSKKELDMRSDVPDGEIVLYAAADGTVKLDVRLEKETVWLTQQLLNCSRQPNRTSDST